VGGGWGGWGVEVGGGREEGKEGGFWRERKRVFER